MLSIMETMPDLPLMLVAALVVVASIVVTNLFRTPVALKPGKPVQLTLREREQLTHDTFRFRFSLASDKHRLGLPVGKHISLRARKDGKEIQRTYTPVSSDDELGYVDFVIKVYFAGVHPKFPDGGKMSQHLHSLKPGDTIEAIGPNGHMEYKGNGTLHLSRPRGPLQVKSAKRIGLIAGGTGVTPMIQLARAALKVSCPPSAAHMDDCVWVRILTTRLSSLCCLPTRLPRT